MQYAECGRRRVLRTVDFDITDAIGRKWQCATIQLDYQQPETSI